MFVVELRQQIIIIIIIGTLSPSRPIDYDEATSNNRRCPSAPSTQLLAMNTPVSLSLVVVCSSTKVQSSLERVFLAILVLDPFDFEIFSQNGKGRKEGIKGHT